MADDRPQACDGIPGAVISDDTVHIIRREGIALQLSNDARVDTVDYIVCLRGGGRAFGRDTHIGVSLTIMNENRTVH
jgi:hypothetical protein